MWAPKISFLNCIWGEGRLIAGVDTDPAQHAPPHRRSLPTDCQEVKIIASRYVTRGDIIKNLTFYRGNSQKSLGVPHSSKMPPKNIKIRYVPGRELGL